MLPWINPSNREEFLEFLDKHRSSDTIVIGHLDMIGFQMQRGVVSQHGFTIETFSGYKEVWSGHYHTRSSDKNIRYLGAATQFTFADADEERGCYVFNSTSGLHFFPSPVQLYHTRVINNTLMTETELEYFSNKYLKLLVIDRGDDLQKYERMIETLRNCCVDLKVTYRHGDFNSVELLESGEGIDKLHDNRILLEKFLSSVLHEYEYSSEVRELMLSMYDEAIVLGED
jgi:DNA repair exonuclease SbcCD nuclease subunit